MTTNSAEITWLMVMFICLCLHWYYPHWKYPAGIPTRFLTGNLGWIFSRIQLDFRWKSRWNSSWKSNWIFSIGISYICICIHVGLKRSINIVNCCQIFDYLYQMVTLRERCVKWSQNNTIEFKITQYSSYHFYNKSFT